MTVSDKHLLKAPLRWWRSRGFGIHSPFAYCFVDEVVIDRHAYYAYEPLRCAAEKASRLMKAHGEEKMPEHKMSYAAACMLFRIGARFDWKKAVEVGHTCGVSESALCLLNTGFRLFVADNGPSAVLDSVTAGFAGRIGRFASVADAIWACEAEPGDCRALIINNPAACADDEGVVMRFAASVLSHEGVVVIRNIHKNIDCGRIESYLCGNQRTSGVSFTNGKATVFIGLGYLQPQRYIVKMPL